MFFEQRKNFLYKPIVFNLLLNGVICWVDDSPRLRAKRIFLKPHVVTQSSILLLFVCNLTLLVFFFNNFTSPARVATSAIFTSALASWHVSFLFFSLDN